MKSHETSSESLKNLSSFIPLFSFFLGYIFQLFIIVKFSLKDLEEEYAKTEDDII